jgi:hypothetical protein
MMLPIANKNNQKVKRLRSNHKKKTNKKNETVCRVVCAAVACVWAQSGCYTGNRGQQICYVVGDLTKTSADALVNAANSQLSHGGGIAGAVRKKKQSKKKKKTYAKKIFFFLLFLQVIKCLRATVAKRERCDCECWRRHSRI